MGLFKQEDEWRLRDALNALVLGGNRHKSPRSLCRGSGSDVEYSSFIFRCRGCSSSTANIQIKGSLMQLLKSVLVIFLAMVMSGTAIAGSMDIAGVKVDDSAIIAAAKVNLNGAGIYYRGPFRVYVAELYVTKKINSLEELIAADGPKRVKMTFVRAVDPALMSKVMTRGIEDNVSRSQMSKLIPGLKRMSDIFTANKTIEVGDVTLLDWIPGTGLVITIKGKTQGEPVKEPEFFNALMAVWLGQNPTYWKLKDEMLGGK